MGAFVLCGIIQPQIKKQTSYCLSVFGMNDYNGFKNSLLHYYLLLFTFGNPSRRVESEE